ncbi:MAG: cadherin-like domain-containing protein [Candidatus Eremiobacteraeota bacterium]|nr:cadherin-like domain-containing protein [Candidatus Eremiobacteraeota bacterium]
MKKQLIILLLGVTFLAGCGGSNDFNEVSGLQGNPVVVGPVCTDDAYQTNQNTVLTVNAANGVLANDAPNGGTVTAFDATSTQLGTVNVNADGSFTYTPAANFTGADIFTYTVTNTAGSATCSVTITVNPVNGFFVDSANGNDGTGSFTGGLPFQTIQAAVTAAGTNQDIIVRPGNYTGQINLLNGQRLLGSGSALAQGAVRPNLTGPVVLADGNTLDFLRIANSPGNAVDGDDQNGGTVTNCEITTATAAGVSAFRISGQWNISSNTVADTGSTGIPITTEGTDTAVVRVNNNIVTGNMFNAIGFITSNSSDLRAQVAGNTMTGNQTGFTFEVIAGDTSTSCYDIEGNTNDDTYRLSGDATATFEVEEFNNLIAVNNNSGTVTMSGGSTAPTSVNDGACGF